MAALSRYEKYLQEEREHCLNCEHPAEYCNGKCEYILEHSTRAWYCEIKDLTTGKIYPSISAAAADLHFAPSTLSKAIRTGNCKVKGHTFKLL